MKKKVNQLPRKTKMKKGTEICNSLVFNCKDSLGQALWTGTSHGSISTNTLHIKLREKKTGKTQYDILC